MDQRYAEKGLISIFSCCRRWVVAGMSRRIRHRNQLATFPDQTQKALLWIYTQLAYGGFVKTVCIHQDVLIAFRIGQIHGAGIDWQGLFDPLNNDAQGLIQICCGIHFLNDLSQSNEHRNNFLI